MIIKNREMDKNYKQPAKKPTTLFYSKKCTFCTELLSYLQIHKLLNEVNFICIDRRQAGSQIVTLDNGQQIHLPVNVNRVPALICILNNIQEVVYGDDIKKMFDITVSTEPEPADTSSSFASFHPL